MGVMKNFLGTMSALFKIGGHSGVAMKNNAGVLQVRSGDDSALARTQVAAGTAADDAVTLLQLQQRLLVIDGGFDGASPPDAASNSGKYYFCHTAGGAYTAGRVYRSDGSAWGAVDAGKGWGIVTGASAISGTVSLATNRLYVNEATAGSPTWTVKGDGSGGASTEGKINVVEIALGTSASASSTTSIPDNTIVTNVVLQVATAYDNSATIKAEVNGGSPVEILGTGENDPATIGDYGKEQRQDVGANGGVVLATITGSPSVGAGILFVEYVETTLS